MDIRELLTGKTYQAQALTDDGSITKVEKLENTTVTKYDANKLIDVKGGTNILTGKKESNETSEAINALNASVKALSEGVSQQNSMSVSPVMYHENITKIGVDQYNGFVNVGRLANRLKNIVLPQLVKIPSTTVIFRPEGGLIINGAQVASYNPASLTTSFILGKTSVTDGSGNSILVPILGYDIKLRPFDGELGDVSLSVEGYESITPGDPTTGTLVYTGEYRREGDGKGISHLVCVPAYTQDVYKFEALSSTAANAGVYPFVGSLERRSNDLDVDLLPRRDNNAGIDFGLRIMGSNAVAYVTPIIPTKEVITRVVNNLVKDGSYYVQALANIYSE